VASAWVGPGRISPVAEDDPYHSQPPRRRLTRVTSNRWAEPAMPNHVGRVRQHREAGTDGTEWTSRHRPFAPTPRFAWPTLPSDRPFVAPFDVAAAADPPGLVLGRIVPIRHPSGRHAAKGYTAWPGSAVPAPHAGGRCCNPTAKHPVAVAARQASPRVAGRSPRSAPVHAFVPPVLVWTARINALGPNVQRQQPDRQLRRSGQVHRAGKPVAVVRAQRSRHPVRPKCLLPGSAAHTPRRLRHCLANHQTMAVAIGHGQRLTAHAVAGAKPTLEVDRPALVRRFGLGQRRLAPGALPPPRLAQIMPAQKITHRVGRRPVSLAVIHRQPGQQLVWTPARTRSAQRDQPIRHARRDGVQLSMAR
jgi:hypothetical protein